MLKLSNEYKHLDKDCTEVKLLRKGHSSVLNWGCHTALDSGTRVWPLDKLTPDVQAEFMMLAKTRMYMRKSTSQQGQVQTAKRVAAGGAVCNSPKEKHVV